MNKMLEFVNTIKQQFPHLANEIEVGPAMSEQEVKNLEGILDVSFSDSYKQYLANIGEFCVLGDEFYGGIINPDRTLAPRIDGHLPKELVIIYDVGNGNVFCINTSKKINGEHGIIQYLPGTKQIEPYAKVTDSFQDFFIETIWGTLVSEGCNMNLVQKFKPNKCPWNMEKKDWKDKE